MLHPLEVERDDTHWRTTYKAWKLKQKLDTILRPFLVSFFKSMEDNNEIRERFGILSTSANWVDIPEFSDEKKYLSLPIYNRDWVSLKCDYYSRKGVWGKWFKIYSPNS